MVKPKTLEPVNEVAQSGPKVAETTKDIYLKNPFSQPITIDDEEDLMKMMSQELEFIEGERNKHKLYQEWQEARDQYDGVVEPKDFPWDNASNLHIHITSMSTDVLRTKAKAQMFVNPMMLCKPLPGQESETLLDDVELKEEFINYKALEELEIKEKLNPVLKDAINIGTGIAKMDYVREIEYDVPDIKIYTVDTISEFEVDNKGQEETDEYQSNHLKLELGQTVEQVRFIDEITKDNPDIQYVRLEDLWIRPDIADINLNWLIGEKITYTWKELLDKIYTHKFNRDKILKLKEKYPNEYYKKTYDLYEMNLYYDYEKTEKARRIRVYYLKEEQQILKAVTYPYLHRQPSYVLYYIEARPDSAYGYGLAKKLKYTNKAADDLWNQIIDAGSLRNAPVFKALRGGTFDPQVKKYGPAAIWWVGNMAEVEQFPVVGGSNETINFISRIERYGEWQTGVSAYMTGRESPLDPNAPMGKAYMLLKESNLRVNDAIESLHRSNKQLFKLMDSLMYQFMSDKEIPYSLIQGQNIQVKKIGRQILGLKVQFVPQLSDITINKEVQKQQDLQFALFLFGNPLIQQNPEAIYNILEMVIRNQGGIWEKEKNKILPPKQKQPMQANQPGQPGQPPAGQIPEALRGIFMPGQTPGGVAPTG